MSGVGNVNNSRHEEVYELQPLFKPGDPDQLFDSPLAERISTLFTMHASSNETEGDPYDDLLLAGKAKLPSSNPHGNECEDAPSAVEARKVAPVEGTIYLHFCIRLLTSKLSVAGQHDHIETPVPSKRVEYLHKEVDVALAKAKAKVVITMFCSVVISQGLATIVAMVMAAVAIGQALILMFFSLIVMMWFMKSIIKDL
ncbi:uncharacterized protein J4E78_010619 [Alternaria triticimaculans]|uniref:uncharacterized protein n=1 Tax=Alternaria triticimaculans TaxID=297637 RepID=UPI0020C3E67D|nr:uncharacterized protein J4E78_010619 [Alternaria triticimaculans]KAI4640495.1 hypothetical protein J4E78_010619 [Alternaria triticimaculans]